jgi:hypothetical protein
MMGSSSHQPPKGKFDDTKGVIRSRISKKWRNAKGQNDEQWFI